MRGIVPTLDRMNDAGLVDHCLELLSSVGRTRARRMFGGHGLYVDDVFIALIAQDRLYLKVDSENRPRFEAMGCEPFVYNTKTGEIALGYWSAPPEAMESPGLMQPWARLALQAALRAASLKRSKPTAARGARRKTATR